MPLTKRRKLTHYRSRRRILIRRDSTPRTALVTLASRGLAVAIALAAGSIAGGSRVAVNYFANAARAGQLCSGLRARWLVAQSSVNGGNTLE